MEKKGNLIREKKKMGSVFLELNWKEADTQMLKLTILKVQQDCDVDFDELQPDVTVFT